jgi:hypothetical protein
MNYNTPHKTSIAELPLSHHINNVRMALNEQLRFARRSAKGPNNVFVRDLERATISLDAIEAKAKEMQEKVRC